MTASHNLALATPNPHVADIGLPKRKTVADYTLELQTLELELAACNTLANDRNIRSYRVQQATTQLALGNGSKDDLQKAQDALDEAVSALMRRQHLEASIGEIKDALRWTEGQERRVFCEGIKAEFDATFDRLKQQSTDMLATYKQLQSIAVRYQGMTNRDIFPAYLSTMHLPVLHGENDWSGTNQPTGRR